MLVDGDHLFLYRFYELFISCALSVNSLYIQNVRVRLVPLPDLLSRMDMPASVETQLVKHLQLFLE